VYQFVSYLWLSLALFIIVGALFQYAWRNRSVLGARQLLLTLVLAEIWIFGQAMEMAALNLPVKIIWANIEYLPIMLTPVTYLYLALHFTQNKNWLRRRWLSLMLLIPPLAMQILLWTNDWHGLIRQNVYLDTSGSFPTVGKTFGPLFWVFAVYNYVLTFLILSILASALRMKPSRSRRRQIVFLMAAFALPSLATLTHVIGLEPINVDITPSILGLSALIFSWGVFRYRLLSVIPVARSLIIQEMRTGMIVLDQDGAILDINPAARKMLDLTAENLNGALLETELEKYPDLVRFCREGKDNVHEMIIDDGGSRDCYEVSLTQIANSRQEFSGWLLQLYNITERKVAEEIIRRAAFYDHLTGLPNRNYFQILFSKELAHVRMRGNLLTVAFMDLDDFKGVNDTLGHDAGDKLLREVADKLKGVLRESDIIARIGGDEYAIVLPYVGQDEKIASIARKILQEFNKSVDLDGRSVQIKASIGFSVFPRDGDNIDVLLKKADRAMYQVKDRAKNSFAIYKD